MPRAGRTRAGGRRGGPAGGIAAQGIRWFNNSGTSRGKRVGIAYGSPGSYRACLRRAHHVPARMRHGYCANRYHEATGRWPGKHNGRFGKGGRR